MMPSAFAHAIAEGIFVSLRCGTLVAFRFECFTPSG
jgi:hypothetical protein